MPRRTAEAGRRAAHAPRSPVPSIRPEARAEAARRRAPTGGGARAPCRAEPGGSLGWVGLCAALAAVPAAAQPMGFGGADAAFAPTPAAGSPNPAGNELGAPADALGASRPPVRLGGFFGAPFDGAGALFGSPPRGFRLFPSLELRATATDNVLATDRNRRADVIGSVNPRLLATANTDWLQGRVLYAPSARFYARTSGQDRLDHRFNGQALATLVPETLFLDLRGAGAVQSISGGFAPEQDALVSRGDRLQTVTFQATPYLLRRFDGLATALLGYSYQYVSQTGGAAFATRAGGGLPYFAGQEITGHTGFAAVRSGEDFGPLALEARASGTSYSGTGVLDGAHRAIGTVEARYAIRPDVAVLVEGGYESQRYETVPPVRIEEPVWSVGVRLAPGPDSLVIARYGHRDGFNSARLDASVALGARTRLAAGYSDRLSTSALRAVDLLSTTSVDELGNPVDTATGAPVLQPFASSFLAVQSGLFRVRRATVAVSQEWPRDVFTLSVFHEERRPVAAARGTAVYSQRGTSGRFAWTHLLAPRTTVLGFLQYGRFDSSALNEGDVYTAGATLQYQFSPSLSGFLQYAFSNRATGPSSDRVVQNIVVASLRQVF